MTCKGFTFCNLQVWGITVPAHWHMEQKHLISGEMVCLACRERNADKAILYGLHDRKEPLALSMLLHSFNKKVKT